MAQHYHLEWLLEKLDQGHTCKFLFFWGHVNKYKEEVGKFCFSQWFELPFVVAGVTYPTAEHWMMAQKALLFHDYGTYEKILQAPKPGEAKELGRQVLGFDEQLWNTHRFDIVKTGNMHKFGQHPLFQAYLLGTGDRILVEASPVDNIWGIGLPMDSPLATNP